MNFQTQYKPYNGSWLAFFTYQGLSLISSGILSTGISVGYNIYNLYKQYAYNISLERELNLKYNNQEITVLAKPSYFNLYTVSNILDMIISVAIACSQRDSNQDFGFQDLIKSIKNIQYKTNGNQTTFSIDNQLLDFVKSINPFNTKLSSINCVTTLSIITINEFLDDYPSYTFINKATGEKIDVQDIINNAEVISVEIVNKNGFGMQIYDAVSEFYHHTNESLFTSGNEIIESRSEETISSCTDFIS